jgi:sorbose reductase
VTFQSFADKVAFVTGAAGGLGRAIAASFAEQGAAVALADLPERANDLEDVASKLPRAIAVSLDVREPGTIRADADRVRNRGDQR